MSGRLRIDLDALAANFQALQAAADPGVSAAVVKADAYGLGALPVAGRLWREGCRHFFVATSTEGRALRKGLPRARIFVFEGATAESMADLIECKLIPVLNHEGQLACWRGAGATGPVAVHVDTGMHRLGFACDLAPSLFDGLEVALLMTHLACADEPRHPLNLLQRERFERVRAHFPGIPASIGNSAGVLLGAALSGDIGRPGIGLYGGNPFAGLENPMATVVTLEGRILQVRSVAANDAIGYGASYQASQPMAVAIVGLGYADGLPRLLSNRGMAAVNGVRRPILGRVSMDLTAVDVTGLAVAAGDWIEFIGSTVPLDEVAGWAQTISYEVLTRLGPRLERIYLAD